MATRVRITYLRNTPGGYRVAVTRLGRTVTITLDKTVQIECNGFVTKQDRYTSADYLDLLFEVMTGGRPHEWRYWLTKARRKCRSCGRKVPSCERGYPDEPLYSCRKCAK